jgi:hypothetical protein
MSNEKNTNTVSFLSKNKKYGNGFSATLIDGLSVDIFEISGLNYSEKLSDLIWGNHNWQTLIDQCSSATIISLSEQDLVPGQSDEIFWIAIDDPIKFKQELRKVILDSLNHLNL